MGPMAGDDPTMPVSRRVKLTYDDFVQLPDDGLRHELIEGEHYVTPSPNTRHQRISIRLGLLIGGWLDAHPGGQLFHAPLDVVFSEFDIVEPDLIYLSSQRAFDLVTAQHVRGVPELVIEIVSPGTRRPDETIKRRLYERAGVDEYWVVDPDIGAVRVYRRHGDLFGRPTELSADAGGMLGTPLLPGLDISVGRIFAD